MYNKHYQHIWVTGFSSQANSDLKSVYSFLWASIWGVKLRQGTSVIVSTVQRELFVFSPTLTNRSNLKGILSAGNRPRKQNGPLLMADKPIVQLHAKLANLCEIYEQIL